MRRFIPFAKNPPTVAVIRLNGMIATGSRPGGGMLNDAALAPVIERAFRKGKPDAVALSINSPGGSPVQSSLIAARIRRLAAEKSVPVYGFVEDVAASGGYWLATAADEIYADASSIVGSIGVISAGFGLEGLIAKHGIERRVHTAGTNKSFMDPFLPEKAEDIDRLLALQADIHAAFKAQVTSRRGGKLADQDLFNGDFWLGQRAVDLGLIDGIGHLVPKMKEMFGDKVRFAVHGPKRGLFQRFGMSLASDVMASVEDRAAFARYGV